MSNYRGFMRNICITVCRMSSYTVKILKAIFSNEQKCIVKRAKKERYCCMAHKNINGL